MRKIGFQVDDSAGTPDLERTVLTARGQVCVPIDSGRVIIAGDGEGGASLMLHDTWSLQQAALWLGEAIAQNPRLLQILRAIVSNAITIAVHVPPDQDRSDVAGEFNNWGLSLLEAPEGGVMIHPQEEAEIKLVVWELGLASAQDSGPVSQFNKLLESAEKLAELIAETD